MRRFLFRFGYNTPAQMQANTTHGWDDEFSGAFFVVAADQNNALAWGQTVADGFVRNLFSAAGQVPVRSWTQYEFAFWIEDAPEAEFTAEELGNIPEVAFGQLPGFVGWTC